MNITQLVDSLGRANIMDALNVSKQSITHALSEGVAPASWYAGIDTLCRAKGFEAPRVLFNFKGKVSE